MAQGDVFWVHEGNGSDQGEGRRIFVCLLLCGVAEEFQVGGVEPGSLIGFSFLGRHLNQRGGIINLGFGPDK